MISLVPFSFSSWIFDSSNCFPGFFWIIPSASTMKCIFITSVFCSLISSLAKFIFTLWSAGTARLICWKVFGFLIWTGFGLLVGIALLFCFFFTSKSQRILCDSFSKEIMFVHVPLFCASKNQSFAKFSMDQLPTQPCLLLYSFFNSLLHSFMWLIVSSLFLSFSFSLSLSLSLSSRWANTCYSSEFYLFLALIFLVLMVLFLVTVDTDFVFFSF